MHQECGISNVLDVVQFPGCFVQTCVRAHEKTKKGTTAHVAQMAIRPHLAYEDPLICAIVIIVRIAWRPDHGSSLNSQGSGTNITSPRGIDAHVAVSVPKPQSKSSIK